MDNHLPKHILVIRLSALGDVAMTVPVLRALAQQYPGVKVTVLSRNFFKPMFDNIPNIAFHEADVKGKHKGVMGLYRLSKEVQELGIDAIADLHNVLRSNILKVFFKWKGIPVVQQDKGRAAKKALVAGKSFQQLKTTHERYADVFRSLGFDLDLAKIDSPSNKMLSERVKVVARDLERPWVGIAPFAAFEGKMYPLPLMEEVIKTLDQKEISVMLFGGGTSEINQLTTIAAKYEHAICVAGRLSFEEELSLIANLKVMVAMDSGNAHLAAMYNVSTITLWGVTHPYAGFYPFGQPMDNALLANRAKFPQIPTSIYGNKMPQGYERAMETILPAEIVKKIEQLL